MHHLQMATEPLSLCLSFVCSYSTTASAKTLHVDNAIGGDIKTDMLGLGTGHDTLTAVCAQVGLSYRALRG